MSIVRRIAFAMIATFAVVAGTALPASADTVTTKFRDELFGDTLACTGENVQGVTDATQIVHFDKDGNFVGFQVITHFDLVGLRTGIRYVGNAEARQWLGTSQDRFIVRRLLVSKGAEPNAYLNFTFIVDVSTGEVRTTVKTECRG